jgi:phosphopantetheine--protein transferase-like protein
VGGGGLRGVMDHAAAAAACVIQPVSHSVARRVRRRRALSNRAGAADSSLRAPRSYRTHRALLAAPSAMWRILGPLKQAYIAYPNRHWQSPGRHHKKLPTALVSTKAHNGVQVEVGVDVEAHRRTPRFSVDKLATRWLSAGEATALVQLPEGPARVARFVQLWTLKEACVKAAGTGIAARCVHRLTLTSPYHRVSHSASDHSWVWKAATSKAEPRQKQDWILKCLQGGCDHPLARPLSGATLRPRRSLTMCGCVCVVQSHKFVHRVVAAGAGSQSPLEP